MKETENDQLEVIAFHLLPDILKDFYVKELPAIIEKNKNKPETQVIIPDDTITKFIESLDFYFQNPSLVNNDLLELKTKELILLLVQTKYVKSTLDLISTLYSDRTINIKKVIELHQFSNLSIEELAKLSNLSLSSFKREFKKEYNDSPANYMNNAKINKAKDLLLKTDLHINEIAYEVGFNDPLYFTRLFSKKVGKSPSEFRKDK